MPIVMTFRRSAIAAACIILTTGSVHAQSSAPALESFGGARTVIHLDEIRASGAASIRDVLRSVPGLQVTDNASTSGSAISLNIGVRGLDGRYSPRSTVLLDGVPLAPAPYGQPQLSFAPVSLNNLESIDVMRSGGAVRYGPQNVGGVINFRTRAIPQGDFQADASVRYKHFDGGNSSIQTSVFAGGGAGDGLGMALLYSGLNGEGSREHSKEQVNDFALKFSFAPSAREELTAKLSNYDARADVPGGLTAAQYDADPSKSYRSHDYWSGRRTGIDLGYLNALSAGSEFELRAWYNDSERTSFLANVQDATATVASTQLRRYEVAGVEPRYTQRLVIATVRNEITVGYRFLRERADERGATVTLRNGATTLARNSENSTDAHSVYLDDRIVYGKWRVTPGLRYEHIKTGRRNLMTRFADEVRNNKALPSVNAAWLASEALTVYANYNTSFASVQHLQLNLQASADSLKPESAKTTELGARYNAGTWQLESTLFKLDFSDQIVFVNTAPLFYKNLGKTAHRGLETRAEYAFGGVLKGLNAYATHAYTQAEQKQGANAGRDVPFYSRNVDTEGVKYTFGGWTVDLHTTHQSKQYADEANTVKETANGANGLIGGYRLWNAHVNWRVPGYIGTELQLGVDNLANKAYFSRTTETNGGKLPGASRTIFVQLRTGF